VRLGCTDISYCPEILNRVQNDGRASVFLHVLSGSRGIWAGGADVARSDECGRGR